MKWAKTIFKTLFKWYWIGILSISYSLAIFLIIKDFHKLFIDDFQKALLPFLLTLFPYLAIGFMLYWGRGKVSLLDSLKKGLLLGLSMFVYLLSFFVVQVYFNQYFELACMVMLIIPFCLYCFWAIIWIISWVRTFK
ncbi:hypothetical protein CHI04_19075 [Bacillus safensis]|nr:hypothetical protein CHI04_19075 [Bacillus safensis]